MTPDEHAHVQKLEGLVKRYRSRIAELKTMRPKFLCPNCGHGIEFDSIIEVSNALKLTRSSLPAGDTP